MTYHYHVSHASAGAKVEATKEDLPEPDTPVTATIQPSGIDTSMLRRLFSLAPKICIHRPSSEFLSSGIVIFSLPDKTCSSYALFIGY